MRSGPKSDSSFIIRLPQPLLEAFNRKCAEAGATKTQVMIQCIERYTGVKLASLSTSPPKSRRK